MSGLWTQTATLAAITTSVESEDTRREDMTKYVTTSWSPVDIQDLRPDWTLRQCVEWLEENERHLKDRLIEAGWEMLKVLLIED